MEQKQLLNSTGEPIFPVTTYNALIREDLNGMKLSLLGDSLSAFVGTIPSGNEAYYTGSNAGVTSSSQMWWSVLCSKLGLTPLVIDAWSGSTVAERQDSGAYKTPMSSDLRCGRLHDGTTMPDIIIIAGGTNDYNSAISAQQEPLAWDGKTAAVIGNSFTEAYACMIKKLQTNYPNAIVVALSTFFVLRSFGTDNGYTVTRTVGSNVYTLNDYDDAIENVCRLMHIPFIRINDVGINRNNLYTMYSNESSINNSHYNAKGQELVGVYLADNLPKVVTAFIKSKS